jgi:hypothetical protein
LMPMLIWSCRKVYATEPDSKSTADRLGILLAIAIVTTCSVFVVGVSVWGAIQAIQLILSVK